MFDCCDIIFLSVQIYCPKVLIYFGGTNLSDSSVNFTALRDEILSDFTILPQENGDVSNVVFMITSSLVK